MLDRTNPSGLHLLTVLEFKNQDLILHKQTSINSRRSWLLDAYVRSYDKQKFSTTPLNFSQIYAKLSSSASVKNAPESAIPSGRLQLRHLARAVRLLDALDGTLEVLRQIRGQRHHMPSGQNDKAVVLLKQELSLVQRKATFHAKSESCALLSLLLWKEKVELVIQTKPTKMSLGHPYWLHLLYCLTILQWKSIDSWFWQCNFKAEVI